MSQRPEQQYFVDRKLERIAARRTIWESAGQLEKDKDIANKLNDTFISISAAQDIDFQSVF